METDVYHHTQVGWLTLAVLGMCALGAVLTGVYGEKLARWIGGSVGVVLVGAAVVFSTLTVRVDDESLTWWFGPGWWTYSIETDRIEDVEVVRTSVAEGWGIRYTPKGRLYNVSGRRAVGIRTSDGAFVRVGTDEPEALLEAIQQEK